ncbi:MAG: poly-beta-1,6-N-acetyl-D-glucosamine N-deacetylase PgaB [Neisseria sp.]|nr:poly-beta-1,6-N-acetyl-D-glucosamine N-deacetylase PgaB [Neisseria sp.]
MKAVWRGLVWAVLFCVQAAWAQVHYGSLVYHDVLPDAAGGGTPAVSRARLVEHFDWLKANGYTPVSWRQLQDAREGRGSLPEKPVLLTFDDGYVSFYDTVFPLLKEYRYPAVLAVVTSWLDAQDAIDYGGGRLPRSRFLTWAQVGELQQSGLVEIASHSDNLHLSLPGNPMGSEFAAALPGHYRNGAYETAAEYRSRIERDLHASADKIEKHTGIRPRIVVWPYGQFSQTAADIARKVGFDGDFSLYDRRLNNLSDGHVGRLMLDEGSGTEFLQAYLEERIPRHRTQKIAHIDLDYIYDADEGQMKRNIDALVERVSRLGVTTVYLQAFADPDGDGTADAVYFPNRRLKVRADLFSRVAWQLMARAKVEVYAWMPMLAVDFGKDYEYLTDRRTGLPDPAHYLRLSPYNAKGRQALEDLYEDLAFHARFNGIIFHDDGLMTDHEGKTAAGKRSEEQYRREAEQKEKDLMEHGDRLIRAALKYSFNGREQMHTARNIYAGVIMDENRQKWFAQSLPAFVRHYDYTAIMAMPYMENEGAMDSVQAVGWLEALVAKVKQADAPLDKVVFELQTVNWRGERPIPAGEIVYWLNTLHKAGVKNIGYYPDNLHEDRPPLKQIKPVLDKF